MALHSDVFSHPHVDPPQPIVAYAMDTEKGYLNEPHSHARGQLLYTERGAVSVMTEHGTFMAPPERAVWVPSYMTHQTSCPPAAQFRSLYIREDLSAVLSPAPSVIQVTGLLRELMHELMCAPRDYRVDGPSGRIAQVILDQLSSLPDAPLQLPMPQNHALMRELCRSIVSCPAHVPSLADAAERVLMSQRTFERRFVDETGWSYRKWCGQAKLLRVVQWLSTGLSVGDVAHKLGYEGPSPFIAQFRKVFGTTPGRYFRSD